MNFDDLQQRRMLQTFHVERIGQTVEVMVDREAINLPDLMNGHGFIAMTAEQAATLGAALLEASKAIQ